MTTQTILAKTFDKVAKGENTGYWMAVLKGYKQLPTIIHNSEEAKGYRIGMSLAGMSAE